MKEKGFALLDTLKVEIIETEKESNFGLRLILNQKAEELFCRGKDIFESWIKALRPKCIFKDFGNIYQCVKVVGKGSFAKVYLAHRIEDKVEFAIKSFDKRGLEANEKNKLSLLMEINIMRMLEHPSILSVYEVYETDNHINLILQILKGGELFDRLVSKGRYNERDGSLLIKNLLSSLDHLHSKGIMHRDLKPENLILASKEDDKNVMLADFGLATFVDIEPQNQLFTRCGTPGYVAPEVLDDMPYTEKVDIFSAGVIMYIILTGCSPFFGKSYNEILLKNKRCKISFDFADFSFKPSAAAIDLMKKMLDKDPAARISAKEALKHEWIVNVGRGFEDTDEQQTSVEDNMRKFNAESKEKFCVMKLKPKDMTGDFALEMKPQLINGRMDTIEETKGILDSPSFFPARKEKDSDLRKKTMLKNAENYRESSLLFKKSEGHEHGNDDGDSFIGDDDDNGFSLRANLDKLNGDQPKNSSSLLSLSEKFTQPTSINALRPSTFSQNKMVRENLRKME